MSSYKTGKWSNDELELVRKYVEEGLSYEQIAARINRPAKTVQSTVEKKLMLNISDEAVIVRKAENDVKSSAEWKQLVKQLTLTEQDVFLNHWRELISQFNNDVTHTEKLQMMDLIRNEILIGRVLERINDQNQRIIDLQTEYNNEKRLDLAIQDAQKLINIQRNISDAQMAIGTFNKEYKDLSERKNATMRDIKGTRADRVKRLEESKETITGWITTIMTEPEIRSELGRWSEKFRIAQIVEYERLSDYHKYEDGSVEQCVLNSETLKDDNY